MELEVQVEGLAELSAAWEKPGNIEAHKAWSKEIEPNVVSGTQQTALHRSSADGGPRRIGIASQANDGMHRFREPVADPRRSS